ncbi:metal ABC transporter permease, partial [Acidiphilium sp. JA12-A1]
VLLGIAPSAGVAGFGLAGVVAIWALGRRGRPEVATALTLVMLLATGALLLSWTDRYAAQVYALLFGQVLGVSRAALGGMALAGAGAVA